MAFHQGARGRRLCLLGRFCFESWLKPSSSEACLAHKTMRLEVSSQALRGRVGWEKKGRGLCLTVACLGPFLSHAEACPAPPAGCLGPSPSADVVHLGSPQGAPCVMAVAGASAGSASVKWPNLAPISGRCVSATSGCVRPTTGKLAQVRHRRCLPCGVTCFQTGTGLSCCSQRRPCFSAVLALFITIFLLLFGPHLSGTYKYICMFVYTDISLTSL